MTGKNGKKSFMKKIYTVITAILCVGIYEIVFAANTGSSAVSPDMWSGVVNPIVDLIDSLLTPALLIVGAIGSIYCVIVAVKFAKADEQQEREKAKAGLKNAGIGFLLIFILIAVLKLGIGPLTDWVKNLNT